MRSPGSIFIAVCLLLGFAGCTGSNTTSETAPTDVVPVSDPAGPNGSDSDAMRTASESLNTGPEPDASTDRIEQVVNTVAVPSVYLNEAQQRGQVVRVAYETYDYTGTASQRITKPAHVYLPYGYDEADTEMRYDILYLMHGWGMTADDFLRADSELINILDNMIERGDIPPIIAVSATFDAENQPQSFSRSVEELAAFHDDWRNDLAVYIEDRFHTYAAGTRPADFQQSRDHRAFAGFSLGAVTTWDQFVYNLDYIKYFVPMSGDCWILGTYGGLYQPVETTSYLEGVVRDGEWAERDFLIYSGIGTDDPIWNQVDSQMQEMLQSTVFTENNLRHAIKQNGRHDMAACQEYLYNALPIFFGND